MIVRNNKDLYYCGIDPGAKGAIAFLNYDGSFNSVVDMPTVEEFIEGLKHGKWDDEGAYIVGIESVHPLPGQSCMASFSYGGNFILAKALGIWYNMHPLMITPQLWKKHYGLKREANETKSQYKGRSVQLARELFPSAADQLKLSKDGRAEALLIAKYIYDLKHAAGAVGSV